MECRRKWNLVEELMRELKRKELELGLGIEKKSWQAAGVKD